MKVCRSRQSRPLGRSARGRNGQEPAVPELEMEHLVADVELEGLAATRDPGGWSGSARHSATSLARAVSGSMDRRPAGRAPTTRGDQWIAQSFSLLGELIDRDAGGGGRCFRMIPARSSPRSRSESRLLPIAGRTARRCLNRLGPSSSSRITSIVQRSPRTSSERASGHICP